MAFVVFGAGDYSFYAAINTTKTESMHLRVLASLQLSSSSQKLGEEIWAGEVVSPTVKH